MSIDWARVEALRQILQTIPGALSDEAFAIAAVRQGYAVNEIELALGRQVPAADEEASRLDLERDLDAAARCEDAA